MIKMYTWSQIDNIISTICDREGERYTTKLKLVTEERDVAKLKERAQKERQRAAQGAVPGTSGGKPGAKPGKGPGKTKGQPEKAPSNYFPVNLELGI